MLNRVVHCTSAAAEPAWPHQVRAGRVETGQPALEQGEAAEASRTRKPGRRPKGHQPGPGKTAISNRDPAGVPELFEKQGEAVRQGDGREVTHSEAETLASMVARSSAVLAANRPSV